MIIEFSVKNYRSIKELQTLSFVATKLDSNREKYPEVDKNNIVEYDKNTGLLKTLGIYGANASGKSNIISALHYFIEAIRKEASSESQLGSLCDPFLFQENSLDTESFFQIMLTLEEKKYRYGFTVKKNPDYSKNPEKESKEIITNEWLYGTKETNQGEYFIRENKSIIKDKLPNEKIIPDLPYEHTLFLTHAAAFDKNGVCALIRNFFIGWTISNFSQDLLPFRLNSNILLEKENKKDKVLQLLSSFNLKYENLHIGKKQGKSKEDEYSYDEIFLVKQYKSKKGKPETVVLNLEYNESAGTKKLFDLVGLLIRAFSLNNSVLILLDEIDSNFHPSLLIKLIGLFNNPAINKSNSQLIFTSHDTNLMQPSIMRRDQFYFTEKDNDDATRLYSLANLKGIRNDADFARQYLAGIYGATPMFDNFDFNNLKDESTLES